MGAIQGKESMCFTQGVLCGISSFLIRKENVLESGIGRDQSGMEAAEKLGAHETAWGMKGP